MALRLRSTLTIFVALGLLCSFASCSSEDEYSYPGKPKKQYENLDVRQGTGEKPADQREDNSDAMVFFTLSVFMILVGVGKVWKSQQESILNNTLYHEIMERCCRNMPAGVVDPAYEGKLIQMTGYLRPEKETTDEVFKLTYPKALLVSRESEMYQNLEEEEHHAATDSSDDDSSTSYNLVQRWSPDWIDSSEFHEYTTAKNPEFPEEFRSREFVASAFYIGEYTLKTEPALSHLRELLTSTRLTMSDLMRFMTSLGNSSVSTRWVLQDAEFYRKIDVTDIAEITEKVGDIRVKFRVVDAGEFTILGQVQDNYLIPFYSKMTKKSFLYVKRGRTTAEDVAKEFKNEEDRKETIRWLAGAIFLTLGFGFALANTLFYYNWIKAQFFIDLIFMTTFFERLISILSRFNTHRIIRSAK